MRSLHAVAKRLNTLVSASSEPNIILKSFLKKREGRVREEQEEGNKQQKISFEAHNSKNWCNVSAIFDGGRASNASMHFVIKGPNSTQSYKRRNLKFKQNIYSLDKKFLF